MRHEQAFLTKIHKNAARDGLTLEAPGPVRPEREGNSECSWTPHSHTVHGDDMLVVWGKFTTIYEPGDYSYAEPDETEEDTRFRMFLATIQEMWKYGKQDLHITEKDLKAEDRGGQGWYKVLRGAWDKSHGTPLEGSGTD